MFALLPTLLRYVVLIPRRTATALPHLQIYNDQLVSGAIVRVLRGRVLLITRAGTVGLLGGEMTSGGGALLAFTSLHYPSTSRTLFGTKYFVQPYTVNAQNYRCNVPDLLPRSSSNSEWGLL